MEKENKVDKETRMSVSIGFGCIVYFIENMKPNQLTLLNKKNDSKKIIG